MSEFGNKHVLDTYVFCMSEHCSQDGLLSMWRGYGGNGNGAAIVFDTSKFDENGDAPIIISKVWYASTAERHEWIAKKINQFENLLKKNHIPNDRLYLPVHMLFSRLKIFSLFTKHHGFKEEQEWRAVYALEGDQKKLLSHNLDYAIGRSGIEPKLKFKIEPVEGLTPDDFSLQKIVCEILLGPSLASPLSQAAVRRMLEMAGKPLLAERVAVSTTPYRAI